MPNEPPRRDRTEPGRRGGARHDSEPTPVRRDGGRSRISDARGYTPRGRTVRESAAASRDAFRPALELVRDPGTGTRRGAGRPTAPGIDAPVGGRPARPTAARGGTAAPEPAGRRTAAPARGA